MTASGSGFHLAGVSVRIRDKVLLDAVELRLRPGRICGVIGRNGAGKSTLLRLLARHVVPDRGSMTLDGAPVGGMSDRGYARRVAYMAQSAPAVEAMVLRDLVALGRYPWHGALGRAGAKDRAAIEAAIARTGLAPLADRLVGTLSGGEAQRARLAMILAQGVDWLLLDEPSAALDIAWALELLTHLRAQRGEGRGIVLALHDMNLAARFCDDLIAVKDGRVIAHGPVPEVFTADLLSVVFGVALQVPEVSGHRIALPA